MDPFAPQYLPFHALNYLLAVVGYTLIGRSFLGLFVPQTSTFFVMRFFRSITEPFLRLFRPVTPGFLHPFAVPLYVAFWIFVLRAVFGITMLNVGLAPSLSGAQG
jgi:uncharacterized protein YggT (Ycf19 family)